MTRTEDQLLERRRAVTDERQQQASVAVGAALFAGLAGGMLAMVGFTTGVARRVERLRDDADLMHRGEPPGPGDPSADELGVLSRRLREAVERLVDAEAESRSARHSAEGAQPGQERVPVPDEP